jgi:hypothetical protein
MNHDAIMTLTIASWYLPILAALAAMILFTAKENKKGN